MNIKTLLFLTIFGMLATGYVTTDTPQKNKFADKTVKKDQAKPFDGDKIVQIGIVVDDVEKYAQKYAHFFGVETPKVIISEKLDKAKTHYHGKPTKARVKQAFFHFDNITIEVLEPMGGPSTWSDYLENHGSGVHHIAFQVKGMDQRIEEMENRGADLIQQGQWTGGSGGRYAYFDSNNQLAVILELLENF